VKRWQFFDLIRRVRELTQITEPVIVGSHSLFAVTEFVPEIVDRSVEADFLLGQHGHEVMEMVRDNLGYTSDFYKQHGYFADPLGMAAVSFTPGWQDRLQPLKDDNDQIVARCLELHDLAVSKLIAGRDKDLIFLCDLLDSRMILMAALMERAETIRETAFEGALLPRLERFLNHLRAQRSAYDLAPLNKLINQPK
jgi:hypothetical protein